MVVCSQLPGNPDTSLTNTAEYLVLEVVEERFLSSPLVRMEHFPEHRGGPGEWSLVSRSSWEARDAYLEGMVRRRAGSPRGLL